jgi:peptidoglycan/xylan/chitin deacetylase (PgdA/CDA1 family)
MTSAVARGLAVHAKRLSKPPVTAMLLASGYHRRLRSRLASDQAVVLCYHHVTGGRDGGWAPFQRGVAQARFERHMRFLRRAMSPVSLRRVIAAVRGQATLPPRAVAVTFDDGYRDNYTVAYPILRQYDIRATFFVTTGFVETGRSFWWDEVYALFRETSRPALDGRLLAAIVRAERGDEPVLRLERQADRVQAAEAAIEALRTFPGPRRDEALEDLAWALGLNRAALGAVSPMMTWAQLREMADGGMDIESHTHTHPMLGLSDLETVRCELDVSRRLIEMHVGRAVEGIAYPDGRPGMYDARTLRAATEIGFRFGCIAEPRRVGPETEPFAVGRAPVANVSLPVFAWDLLRAYAVA